jgi:hypothetical protein
MTNPHIGSLDAAREQLVKQRRQLVEELAKPWVRGKTDDFRESFVKVQQAIAAIDEALKDEKKSDPDVAGITPNIGSHGLSEAARDTDAT